MSTHNSSLANTQTLDLGSGQRIRDGPSASCRTKRRRAREWGTRIIGGAAFDAQSSNHMARGSVSRTKWKKTIVSRAKLSGDAEVDELLAEALQHRRSNEASQEAR